MHLLAISCSCVCERIKFEIIYAGFMLAHIFVIQKQWLECEDKGKLMRKPIKTF